MTRKLPPFSSLVFRVHAVQRMFSWQVTVDDVHHVLMTGEVIEDYPDDTSYPSCLVLGWCGTRPLHVVVASNVQRQETIVVTVYEPDPAQWEPGLKRRRT